MRSENVGMSSEKNGENPFHRKPKGFLSNDRRLRVSRDLSRGGKA